MSGWWLSASALLLFVVAPPPRPGPVIITPTPMPGPIPVAKVAYVDNLVERMGPESPWATVIEGTSLRTGDRLRTGPLGTARLDFPWARVLVGSSSVLSVPASMILSTVLEEGRIEQSGEGGDIIKLQTAEVAVRGEGHLVARRHGDATLLTVLDGSVRVDAGDKSLVLKAGEGTIVRAGRAPTAPTPLPSAPSDLTPGGDPAYFRPGETITLSWLSTGEEHHIQVLGIDSDAVLIDRDVPASPVRLQIPWIGTFRWRVSVRNRDGLEGPPSTEGLICMVEK